MALSWTGGTFVPGSKARYDPFGTFTTTTPTSNPAISNHGFTGHRHNNTGANDFDLIYMNARYYLPQIGRFVSPDTIVPEPGNPQSYNRYSYVRNNPMNFTDPTGHRECKQACVGEVVNQQELQFASAYDGSWDPDQQAANAAMVETVLVDVPQSILGVFWEPADWGFALRDGVQWYDAIGMLPLVPATVGRYGDDVVDSIAKHGDDIVFRALRRDERANIVDGIFGRSWPADEVSPISHVAGARHSPWISTGTNYEKIRELFDSGNGIVVIDLSKVNSVVVDFSNGIPGLEGNMISNFARIVGEKLIKDFVPPEAILKLID